MACELQQVGGTGDTAALSSLTLGMAPQGWMGSAPLLEGDLEASPAALSLPGSAGCRGCKARHRDALRSGCRCVCPRQGLSPPNPALLDLPNPPQVHLEQPAGTGQLLAPLSIHAAGLGSAGVDRWCWMSLGAWSCQCHSRHTRAPPLSIVG